MLFRPSFPKNVFEFSETYLSAIALEKVGNQYQIGRASVVSLPKNLIRPSFYEKNLMNPDELVYLIRETTEYADLKRRKRWSVVLPNETARTAIVTIEGEPSSKKELYEILDWKAEKAFGVEANQIRISEEKIASDTAGKSRYIITAVKLSILEEYETIFKMLNWKVGLILPRLLGEMKWLLNFSIGDSILISFQTEGFSAIILRNSSPIILRSINCQSEEAEDEIYRLLMFYKDKIAENPENPDRILVIGNQDQKEKMVNVLNEALGTIPKILSSEDLNFQMTATKNLNFDVIAASAGVATLAWG
ncbi:MAG: hypothetical protein N2Z23_03130 [Pyrinomonadaceae bacterium]|nr:hypothetical protein [Pyrinomonadaceae bacterium]MCX7639421.1 hypothetical protein [Pyrinomonadaceae bacterium]MDW8304529.1 hypothetical protein [Acidobacteriota bacterium]